MGWVKNKVLHYIDLSKCLKTNLICGLRIQLGPQTEDGEKIGLDSFNSTGLPLSEEDSKPSFIF